jgi:hypothetical protein
LNNGALHANTMHASAIFDFNLFTKETTPAYSPPSGRLQSENAAEAGFSKGPYLAFLRAPGASHIT